MRGPDPRPVRTKRSTIHRARGGQRHLTKTSAMMAAEKPRTANHSTTPTRSEVERLVMAKSPSVSVVRQGMVRLEADQVKSAKVSFNGRVGCAVLCYSNRRRARRRCNCRGGADRPIVGDGAMRLPTPTDPRLKHATAAAMSSICALRRIGNDANEHQKREQRYEDRDHQAVGHAVVPHKPCAEPATCRLGQHAQPRSVAHERPADLGSSPGNAVSRCRPLVAS